MTRSTKRSRGWLAIMCLTPALFLKTFEENRDFPPERYASEIVWPMLALRRPGSGQDSSQSRRRPKIFASEYGPKVQVRMIAVQDRKTADEIHAQVTAAPETLKKIAKEKSIDAASASVEGHATADSPEHGDIMLERVAFQLQPNQVSHRSKPQTSGSSCSAFVTCQPTRHRLKTFQSSNNALRINCNTDRLIKASEELFKDLQKGSQVVQVVGNPELEKQFPNIAGTINGEQFPWNNWPLNVFAPR